MRSLTIAALAAVASAQFDEMDVKFMKHIAQYGLQFKTMSEFAMRKEIFAKMDAYIEEINSQDLTWKAAHNKLSTWTEDELASIRNRSRTQPDPSKYTGKPRPVNQTFPTSWDWISQGCVNPVQDQGQCGSCWAFSAVAALESEHCIVSGQLQKYSEQQVVDCCGSRYNCAGCNGGWQYQAFNYYEFQPAFAMFEADYPYTATDTPCAYSSTNNSGVTVTNWSWSACAQPYPGNCMGTQSPYIPSVDEIKASLINQPLSISIEANKPGFQAYSTGVFGSTHCGTMLDHAVVMVGWGVDSGSGLPYWNVRNSWGTSWGNQGYIWMEIQGTGTDQMVGVCGCQMEPVYPYSN